MTKLAIEFSTGVKNPVGGIYDFNDLFVVANAHGFKTFNADGKRLAWTPLRGRITSVRYDGCAYHLSTRKELFWRDKENQLHGQPRLSPDWPQEKIGDHIVTLEKKWLRYRFHYQHISTGTHKCKSIVSPFPGNKPVQFSGFSTSDELPKLWLCNGGNTAFILDETGVHRFRLPRAVHRLYYVNGEAFALGYSGREVYCYGLDGRLRYPNERFRPQIPFEYSGFPGVSNHGDLIFLGDRDFCVFDHRGRLTAHGQLPDLICDAGISNCGCQIFLLGVSGRVWVFVREKDNMAPDVSYTDVAYLTESTDDKCVQDNPLRRAIGDLRERKQRHDVLESQARLEEERLCYLREELEALESRLKQRKEDLTQQERLSARYARRIEKRRTVTRRRSESLRNPDCLSTRLKRMIRRTEKDIPERDRLIHQVEEGAAFVKDTQRCVDDLKSRLDQVITDSAQLQVREKRLKADLELRTKDYQLKQKQCSALQERYESLADEIASRSAKRDEMLAAIRTLEESAASMEIDLRNLATATLQLERQTEELQGVENELAKVQSNLASVQGNVQDLSRQHEDAQNEVKALTAAADALASELDGGLSKKKVLERAITDDKSRLEELSLANIKNDRLADALADELEQLQPLTAKLKRKRTEVAAAKKKVLSAEAKLVVLNGTLEDCAGQHQSRMTQVQQLRAECERQESSLVALSGEIADLERQRKDLESQTCNKKKIKELIGAALQQLEQESEGIREQVAELKALEADKSQQMNQRRELTQRNDKLRVELAHMQELVAGSAELEIKLASLKSNLGPQYEHALALKAEIEKLSPVVKTHEAIRRLSEELLEKIQQLPPPEKGEN